MTDTEQDTPGTDPIQRVFQAVGEASGCWIGGTGDAVFDEAAAVRCADSLIEDLRAMGVNL
jgi:hypothetical protein